MPVTLNAVRINPDFVQTPYVQGTGNVSLRAAHFGTLLDVINIDAGGNIEISQPNKFFGANFQDGGARFTPFQSNIGSYMYICSRGTTGIDLFPFTTPSYSTNTLGRISINSTRADVLARAQNSALGPLKFFFRGFERARYLGATGENFLINTTTTLGSTPSPVQIGGNASSPSTNQISWELSGSSPSTRQPVLLVGSTGNGVLGRFQINNSSVEFVSLSDYRRKTNIQDLKGSLDTMRALNPVSFVWNDDATNTRQQGFIAHEVQQLVPEAVTGSFNAVDRWGNPRYQMLDQTKLIPVMTAAVQEIARQLEQIKARRAQN